MYACVSLLASDYDMSMCVTLIQSTSEKTASCVLDLNKLDALLHKTHTSVLLVPMHQGSAYVDLLLLSDMTQPIKSWKQCNKVNRGFGQNLKKKELTI